MIELRLYGLTGAKKDRLTPHKKGMFIGPDLRAELNDLESQVPGEARDLQLEHPDIIFKFSSKSDRRDKDGMMTTILDVLVKCGTLRDDNIKHCNGTWTVMPADVGETDEAHVMIFPK